MLGGVADLEDSGAVLVDLFEADAIDFLELGEGAGALEDDAAQGGGAEDEELREAEAVGFGLAPVAEALVEELLLRGEGVGGFGLGFAGALEGLDWCGWAAGAWAGGDGGPLPGAAGLRGAGWFGLRCALGSVALGCSFGAFGGGAGGLRGRSAVLAGDRVVGWSCCRGR